MKQSRAETNGYVRTIISLYDCVLHKPTLCTMCILRNSNLVRDIFKY